MTKSPIKSLWDLQTHVCNFSCHIPGSEDKAWSLSAEAGQSFREKLQGQTLVFTGWLPAMVQVPSSQNLAHLISFCGDHSLPHVYTWSVLDHYTLVLPTLGWSSGRSVSVVKTRQVLHYYQTSPQAS